MNWSNGDLNNGIQGRAVDPWSPVTHKQNAGSTHVLPSTINNGKYKLKTLTFFILCYLIILL